MAVFTSQRHHHHPRAPLADACVTEWRTPSWQKRLITRTRHSLMLVLLNGGTFAKQVRDKIAAPLADACVTEWRYTVKDNVVLSPCATR